MNKSIGEDIILQRAERYAHRVYTLTEQLPRSELFGLISQLKRAALSVALNIVEGYARQSTKTQLQFLKIAYGSLKESQFIIRFAQDESYLMEKDSRQTMTEGDEIASMLWVKIQTLKKQA